MQQEQGAWALVKESCILLKSNAQVLLPYVMSIALGIGMLFLPVMGTIAELEQGIVPSTAEFLWWVVLIVIVSIALNFVVYGWVFAGVGPIVHGSKVSIKDELKPGLKMGWVMFVQMLIILLFLVAAVVVGAVCAFLIAGSYKISMVLGVLLTVVGLLVLIAGLLWFMAYAIVVSAVLIVERPGPWEALVKAWRFFWGRLSSVARIFGVALVLLIMAAVPQVLYNVSLEGKSAELSQGKLVHYSLVSALLSIPSIVIFTVLLIAYGLFYLRSTTSGEKPASKAARRKR
jgi:hypothetical protein